MVEISSNSVMVVLAPPALFKVLEWFDAGTPDTERQIISIAVNFKIDFDRQS